MIFYGIVLVMTLLPALVDGFLIILWHFQRKEEVEFTTLPAVSILVAVRNEERNIRGCIERLLTLDYPKDLFEILIGDDSSTDDTLLVSKEFAKDYPKIKIFEISENIGHQKGKANVLAQLAQRAKGDYLFFTDADTLVPNKWVKNMLQGFSKESTGLVSGVTVIEGERLWQRFQFFDWLYALAMVKLLNDIGYSATALGNNMAVTKQAYNSVGGYENIPFSVTEDLELLQQIKKKGFRANQVFEKDVLAWTSPEPSFARLLYQRKRWMAGAVKLPFLIVFALGVQALFFPFMILLFYLNLPLAVFILGLKILFQTLFIGLVARKLQQKTKIYKMVLYEFYSAGISLSLLLFYFLPIKIKWKGRSY